MWLLKECAKWQKDRIAHNAVQRDAEVGHRKEGLNLGMDRQVRDIPGWSYRGNARRNRAKRKCEAL